MAREKINSKDNAEIAKMSTTNETTNKDKIEAKVKEPKTDAKSAKKEPAIEVKTYGSKADEKKNPDKKPGGEKPKKMTAKEKRASRKEEDKKPKVKNIKARLLVAGIILVLLASSVAVFLNLRLLTSGDPLNAAGVPGTPNNLKGKSLNILFCGIDQDAERKGEEELTDMIMVVNLDRENNKATLLQVPRDTYVGENVVRYGKINGLYYFGYSEGFEGFGSVEKVRSGIGCLANTIYNMFQLPIDNYIMLTMEGFRVAIDAVGGVEITMTTTIEMKGVIIEGNKVDLVFEEGKTYLLDGQMADYFVRHREGYDFGDIERLDVQRHFMTALMEKMLNMTTMELVSLVRTIYPYLETDFTINDIIKLAQEVQELTTADMTFVRLPGENVPRYGYYGVDVFTLHKKKTAEILNQYMRPHSDPVPETELEYIIELQNTVPYYEDDGTNMSEYS